MRLASRAVLAGAACFSACCLVAQPVKIDVEGYYGLAQSPNVDGYRAPQLDYRTRAMYGGGVNVRWIPQLSTLFTASTAEPSLRLIGDPAFEDFPTVGQARTTPLAVIAQWHILGLSSIDPYVGAGAAWVLASDLSVDPALFDRTPVRSVTLDDQLAFVADAGARFRLFGPVGFLVDVRYIPVHLDATVRFENGDVLGDVDVKADQFLFGFGLSFRF
jgi:hypothetical protein